MTSSFAGVVRSIEDAARLAVAGSFLALDSSVGADVARAFRSTVSITQRKRAGTFFTGYSLSSQVARGVPPSARVCDPACGIGDLLLSHARQLPVSRRLDDTLDAWAEQLIGRELQDRLLRVTRARLALAAAQRFMGRTDKGARSSRALDSLFPNLVAGDGLAAPEALRQATHVWLNPPFGSIVAPKDCSWSSGTVSAAAVFVDRCLRDARSGTRITAILPDVLRSGSRYEYWRTSVGIRADIQGIEVVGKFDRHTGVDVFVLRLKVRPKSRIRSVPPSQSWTGQKPDSCVGRFFRVSVGPLVAFRAPQLGPWFPFLDVAAARRWMEIANPPRKRRFQGKILVPPFVVVRRTSSPHDRQRAVATLVTGTSPIAVENHLIVVEPLDGSIETCRAAMDVLARPRTTDWLNERIRCRHLTVGAVEEIPW